MLVTHSVLPSGATPMPCEGASVRRSITPNPPGSSGSFTRATSLRAAKSTTAKPLKLDSCAKMRRVRGETDAVRGLDAVDDLHHLVGSGVDDVDVVAGAVGHVDADRLRGDRQCCQGEEDRQVPDGGRHGFLLEAASVAPANIG